jgi:hypothetical protein
MPPITGNFGAVYLGASPVKVADTYDWTLELTAQVHRTSVKGDSWERTQSGRGNGTLTIDRYIATTAALTDDIIGQVAAGNTPITFQLDVVDSTAGFHRIEGTGYITRGTIAIPHDDAARDSVEITLDGVPTFSTIAP